MSLNVICVAKLSIIVSSVLELIFVLYVWRGIMLMILKNVVLVVSDVEYVQAQQVVLSVWRKRTSN